MCLRRASALDDALLRPGRFDRKIYMGRPSATNRLRILQVHARDKPIDRTNDDAVLREARPSTCPHQSVMAREEERRGGGARGGASFLGLTSGMLLDYRAFGFRPIACHPGRISTHKDPLRVVGKRERGTPFPDLLFILTCPAGDRDQEGGSGILCCSPCTMLAALGMGSPRGYSNGIISGRPLHALAHPRHKHTNNPTNPQQNTSHHTPTPTPSTPCTFGWVPVLTMPLNAVSSSAVARRTQQLYVQFASP